MERKDTIHAATGRAPRSVSDVIDLGIVSQDTRGAPGLGNDAVGQLRISEGLDRD